MLFPSSCRFRLQRNTKYRETNILSRYFSASLRQQRNRLYPVNKSTRMISSCRMILSMNSATAIPAAIQNKVYPISRFIAHTCDGFLLFYVKCGKSLISFFRTLLLLLKHYGSPRPPFFLPQHWYCCSHLWRREQTY